MRFLAIQQNARYRISFLTTLIVGILAMTGCNQAIGKESQADSFVVEFEPRSAEITKDQQQHLKEFLRARARSTGEPLETQIFGWADKPISEKLTNSDQELANKRIARLRRIVEENGNKKIISYNMTETSIWIAQRLNANEPELKSQFGMSGNSTIDDATSSIVRDRGGLSKGLVVIEIAGNEPARPKK